MKQYFNANKMLLACALALLPVAAFAESGMVYDYTDWLRNLATHMPQVLKLIVAFSYISGVILVSLGVLRLRAYGQQTVFMSTHADAKGPMIYMIVGSILIFFPHLVDLSLYTLWGYGSEEASALNYPYDISFNFRQVITPVIEIVRIVGYIAFLRGWFMIARMGQQGGSQPGAMSKALLHIIGGILAINIVGTWTVLDATFKFAFVGN